ncbi:MAG TPA: hypothetical protein VI488_04125 [Candidatus Angelobacter sp.]
MILRPLFKAVLLLGVAVVVAAPQDRPAAVPGPETQFQTPQSRAPQAPAAPTQAHQAPVPVTGPPVALVPLPQDANEYVQQAIEHELAEQARDHVHWRYHYHREDEKNNADRDVIETSEGSLARVLLLWGKPLTAEQRQKDEERMRKQVTDTEERARIAKRNKEDDEKVGKMLRAIPKAFIFKYNGEEKGVVRLSFVPNPKYDPPSMEQKIFRSLNGMVYVDRAQNRLAGVEGTLFEDVNFGWGILGRLYKGGTFKVTMKDLGDGHWEVGSEEVNMIGRAVLFKTITRKQKEIYTDHRRMPDSITLAQAFEILQKESGSSSASSAHAAFQAQEKR